MSTLIGGHNQAVAWWWRTRRIFACCIVACLIAMAMVIVASMFVWIVWLVPYVWLGVIIRIVKKVLIMVMALAGIVDMILIVENILLETTC